VPEIPHDEALSIETVVVRAGRPAVEPDAPLNSPIVPASAFHAGGSTEYARETAPTTEALESAVGALEHGSAIAYSSGMAAANAAIDIVPMGAVVVAPSAAYTGVAVRLRELAAIGRITLRIVEADDTAGVVAACEDAHLLWLESPTNPMLQVADLPACIAGAHAAGALALVDNTFATPILQTPLDLGADIVMHSATKAIAGHSDLLMGILIARDPDLAERLRIRRVLLGAAPGAFDCYLALRGLRTLALRVERGQQSAQRLAPRLADHPAVERLRYPGFGTMASIEVLGGADAADRLAASVRVWTHATSLGGVESLLERRRRWPLEASTVPESLVRLSFGIENAEDLWRDLDRALHGSQS
jgi:cystathionine gamma-synthase